MLVGQSEERHSVSRRATIDPIWLDRMLIAWGLASVREALGFPPISPMFKERIGQRAQSYEPQGYCRQDFSDLEEAIDGLDYKYRLVLTRCYKPWTAVAIEAELQVYAVTDRTWQRWLHEAAAQLATRLRQGIATSIWA